METIEITPAMPAQYDAASGVITDTAGSNAEPHLPLTEFIESFGDGLLAQVRSQNPPVYDPVIEERLDTWRSRQAMLDGLKRKPFKAQAHAVHAVHKLLVDENQPAAVINAEMGTGKTMMAICAAALMQKTHPRTLVISPPHLVYKWRREIHDSVPGA